MSTSNKLIINTAHSAGRTFLAFSRDGSIAYTGGCDSLVRVWKTESGTDQEPDTALDAEEPITALATDNDGWLSGSDDSQVRRYMKSSTDLESLVTRAVGVPIRGIAVDPKGRRVAVTSDELVVKVIDLDDTTNIKLLNGHKRGVRSASWHPSGHILTTCGADGKIIAWDLTAEEPEIQKAMDGIIPTIIDSESDEFGHDCTALWHNSGQYFIIATPAHEIVTVSQSTWSKSATFSDSDCTGTITALALSVNGVYLASACKGGIFVWSTATRRVVVRQSIPTDVVVQRLAFSPAHNLLAWTDSGGNFTRWSDVVPPTAPSPYKSASSVGFTAPLRRQASPLFGQEIDSGAADLSNAADDVDVYLEERDDDWIIDDLGEGLEDKTEKGREYGLREMVSVTKAQSASQPGSTPFQNKRRYLSFNNIGVVEVVDQDTHHIVNVEFFDQTTRKNYHFSDHFKYDLAAVGERGVVYACPPENDHPARITYKPYSTWSTHGEWTYVLPKGERAIAVAAGGISPTRSLRKLQEADVEGNGYVAVATDKGVIRFFSGGGIQRGPIWAIDGDVVSMVAGRDYVFVVHREGGTSLDGNQNLKYTLMTSDTYRVMHTGRLPVNKGQTLKWIGITDEGAPVIYDSSERVVLLEHFRFTSQGSWVVLLDASTLARKVGKDESYWPIGVTKSTLMCIILKGREEYPGFPRPLAQEIEMSLPYLEMDSPEAQKEERLARETILLDLERDTLEDDAIVSGDISKAELELDKEIIQLIQLSCKHDRLQRAVDAAKLLHNAATFDMAIKVAEFYHLAGLQEKFRILKAVRQESDRLRDDRDRRRDWRRAAGPIPPSHDIYASYAQHTTRPLQDAKPAPPIHRPRLSTAAPSSEPSPFSRKPTNQMESDVSHTYVEDSPPPEKRKRDDEDDKESIVSTSEMTSKRRMTDENTLRPERPAARPNPFAKKSSANKDEDSINKANPFLRKLTSNKSLHKSDSFFDKVNAAETEAESMKQGSTKPKKQSTIRQTTLFGLPPGSGTKKSRNSKDINESQTQIESQLVQGQTPIAEVDTSSDVAMDGENSQFADVSQTETSQETTQVDDAAETQDDEPLEWPPTPPRVSTTLAAEA